MRRPANSAEAIPLHRPIDHFIELPEGAKSAESQNGHEFCGLDDRKFTWRSYSLSALAFRRTKKSSPSQRHSQHGEGSPWFLTCHASRYPNNGRWHCRVRGFGVIRSIFGEVQVYVSSPEATSTAWICLQRTNDLRGLTASCLQGESVPSNGNTKNRLVVSIVLEPSSKLSAFTEG